MPLYEFECDKPECGDRTEVLLLLREYTDGVKPSCETCQGPMHRIYLSRREHAQHFDPIVFHQSADGRMRFPGTTDAPMPPGFERREIRTMAEYDKFRRTVERVERSKVEKMTEIDHMHAAISEDQYRGDLRMAMQSMSPAHRELARLAIEYGNNSRTKSFDPNFFVEAMEYDQGNREPERDARTGWKHRRR